MTGGRPNRKLLAAALALLGCLPVTRGQGGPPMLTDDPGTPGPGHWEVNVAWLREQRPGGSVDELPLLDLNYGVGDRLQLKYEASLLSERHAGLPDGHGMSNSLVGVKWRFLDEERDGVALSTYPQIEFRNPASGAARRGLSADENSLLLPVEAVRTVGPVEINVDFGGTFHSRTRDGWFGGCAVGRQVDARLELMVELHAQGERLDRLLEVAANLGARVKCTAHGTLLLSVGRELTDHDEPRATLLSYVGWQTTL